MEGSRWRVAFPGKRHGPSGQKRDAISVDLHAFDVWALWLRAVHNG